MMYLPFCHHFQEDNMLYSEEKARYTRQIELREIGIEGQEKLKQAKVLVIGAGGLGCAALQSLSMMGIGSIGIVDFDVVSLSNLARQALYTLQDLGKLKVHRAIDKLKDINPNTGFMAYNSRLTSQNALEIIKKYDLILDCTDNRESRYLINDACVLLQKCFVYASIHRFEGQVSVFNWKAAQKNTPSYRCLFPEDKTKDKEQNCNEAGVLGVLPNIIGTIQANEAAKIILEYGSILSGKLLLISLLDYQQQLIGFERDEAAFELVPKTEEEFKTLHIVTEVDAETLKSWEQTQPEDLLIVDVRERNEKPEFVYFKKIPYIQLPLFELTAFNWEIYADKKIIFVCQSGVRSKQAVTLLLEKALHKNCLSLSGGIERLQNYYQKFEDTEK